MCLSSPKTGSTEHRSYLPTSGQSFLTSIPVLQLSGHTCSCAHNWPLVDPDVLLALYKFSRSQTALHTPLGVLSQINCTSQQLMGLIVQALQADCSGLALGKKASHLTNLLSSWGVHLWNPRMLSTPLPTTQLPKPVPACSLGPQFPRSTRVYPPHLGSCCCLPLEGLFCVAPY